MSSNQLFTLAPAPVPLTKIKSAVAVNWSVPELEFVASEAPFTNKIAVKTVELVIT